MRFLRAGTKDRGLVHRLAPTHKLQLPMLTLIQLIKYLREHNKKGRTQSPLKLVGAFPAAATVLDHIQREEEPR